MSTNHTANYQLSQWEPSDTFVRVDFNEDNAKTDAALHALNLNKANRTDLPPLQELESKKADRTELAALSADIALRCRMRAGVYKGNGSNSQHIDVGFPVEAVLIENSTGSRNESWNAASMGGLAVKGGALYHLSLLASVSGNGFDVRNGSQYDGAFNQANASYLYVAWGT